MISGAPTPTPAGSPTAAPTPTPTGSGPSLLSFSGSQQFNTLETVLLYERSASGALTAFTYYPVTNDMAVIYDAGTAADYYYFGTDNIPPHNVYPNAYSVRFGAATRDGTYSTQRGVDGSASYTLRRLTPGSNALLSLSYVSIGTAEGTLSNNGSVTTDYRVSATASPLRKARCLRPGGRPIGAS